MGFILMTLLVALALYPATTSAFRTHIPSHLNRGRALQCDSGGQENYSNPVAAVLSNFIKKEDAEVEDEKVMDIDFNVNADVSTPLSFFFVISFSHALESGRGVRGRENSNST